MFIKASIFSIAALIGASVQAQQVNLMCSSTDADVALPNAFVVIDYENGSVSVNRRSPIRASISNTEVVWTENENDGRVFQNRLSRVDGRWTSQVINRRELPFNFKCNKYTGNAF